MGRRAGLTVSVITWSTRVTKRSSMSSPSLILTKTRIPETCTQSEFYSHLHDIERRVNSCRSVGPQNLDFLVHNDLIKDANRTSL